MAGQGFVPVAGANPRGNAAAPAAQGAQGAAEGPAADGSLPVEQALKALEQVLGGAEGEYGAPIIAADGSVYMEKRRPSVVNGNYALSYVLVGRIDKATGRMKINPAVLEEAKAKAGPQKKLVKVDDQYVWQTFTKGEDGKVTAEVVPATEQELAAYQQQMQAQQAKQAAEAKLQGRGDWQQKIGTVAQQMGLFGSAGSFVTQLSNGPNPYTGRPSAGWISGWILAQRLNGKAEGKLLPKWLQSGPVATAIEWGVQGWSMLDMGNDVRTLRTYLKGTPPGTPPPPLTNPNAVKDLIAKGHHPAVADAMQTLGKDLRDGTLQMVDGSANAAVLNTKLGAVQLVPKSDLHTAFEATETAKSAGLKLRGNIDNGIIKGFGLFEKLIQPAMIGATALGLVSSVLGVRSLVDTKGKGVLLDTQQGRGAVLGAASSGAFLGMYLLPMALKGLGVAVPAIAAASAAVNIVSNVLGGVQMLNSYGLFGENGFLNNDALRAAFLIPPLTPIGAFAFWMKARKKRKDVEAAQVKAAEKVAVERIAQQREMAKLQLQQAGTVSGASVGKDGSVSVATGVPQDPSKLVAQLGGALAGPAPAAAPSPGVAPASQGNAALAQQRQQLTMATRPG